MNSVLEVLHATRANISPETYNYDRWNTCTCGHIYRYALGENRGNPLTQHEVRCSQNDLYLATLKAIIEANDLENTAPGEIYSYSYTVSHAVKRLAVLLKNQWSVQEALSGETQDERLPFIEVTLELINKTIEVEEQKNKQARLALLEQVQTIVNNTEEVRELEPVC